MLNEKNLLTQAEVEERLGIGNTGIWRWVKAGKFPKPLKPGGLKGKKYYRLDDIIAFEKGKYPPKGAKKDE